MAAPQEALFQLRFQKPVGWVQLHVNIDVIEKSKRWRWRDEKPMSFSQTTFVEYNFVPDIRIYSKVEFP